MATSWPEGNTELFLSIDQNGVMFWGEEYEKMIFFPKHTHTNIITDMKSENITTTALKVHDDGLEIFHSCHCFASQILRFFSKPKFTYTILLLYYLIFCDFFF